MGDGPEAADARSEEVVNEVAAFFLGDFRFGNVAPDAVDNIASEPEEIFWLGVVRVVIW